jgi:hypothetical protein
MGKQLALDQLVAGMLACSHVRKKGKKRKRGREGGVVGQIFAVGGKGENGTKKFSAAFIAVLGMLGMLRCGSGSRCCTHMKEVYMRVLARSTPRSSILGESSLCKADPPRKTIYRDRQACHICDIRDL